MNVALIENLNEHSYKMGWKEVSERYERFLRDLQRIFHKRAWLHLDYQLIELQTFRSVRIELRIHLKVQRQTAHEEGKVAGGVYDL